MYKEFNKLNGRRASSYVTSEHCTEYLTKEGMCVSGPFFSLLLPSVKIGQLDLFLRMKTILRANILFFSYSHCSILISAKY